MTDRRPTPRPRAPTLRVPGSTRAPDEGSSAPPADARFADGSAAGRRPSPRRVVFLIDRIYNAAGGSEAQLLSLLRGLDRSRFDVRLVCLRSSPWLEQARLDVPLVVYGVNKRWRPLYWRSVLAFARLCRRERVDIVQTWSFDADVFGAIAAALAKRPLLVCSRRNVGHWQTPGALAFLRLAKRRVALYLANSRAAAARALAAEGATAGRVAVVPNALDLSRFDGLWRAGRERRRIEWGLRPGDRVVGIVANHRAVKNIDALIRVAARLARDYPHLRVVSVGDGPMRADLERLRDSLGLSTRVAFVGQAADVVPCLAAFDYAVLASTHESLSNSLMEYMAAGLPIVASRAGGNSELVTDGETGLLFDPGDDGQLERALRRLLDDDDLARRLGESARRQASARFGVDRCIRAHETLYASLLRPRERDGR